MKEEQNNLEQEDLISGQPVSDSLAKIADLEIKCEEYLNGWKRAKADYENLRLQSEDKIGKSYQMAVAAIVAELLPIFEHFKLALNHLPEESAGQEWAKGFNHIKDEFWNFLKKLEIKEVPTVGEMFDPALHEAVSYEDSNQPDGTITRELKAGYTLAGELLSPAQVSVANNNNNNN